MSTAAPAVVTPEMTDPNSTQLYINNLNFNTTAEALTSFFQSKLQVAPSDVNIVTNKWSGRSKGFGFVRVPKEKLVLALQLNGATLDEREVGVVEARERTEEERQAQREKRDARRKEISDKRRQEKADAAAANPSASAGAPATSTGEAARPRRPRAERKVYDNATQLYFSNLAYEVTKERLKELVDEAIGAEALEVDILTRRVGKFKGRSRGYGFVTVPTDKLEKGLALNGTEISGREVSVVVARERKVDDEELGEAAPAAAGSAIGADGEAKPKRRTRAPRRNRPPRQANGDEAESKDAEGAAAAAGGSSTTVAAGSSAPTPAAEEGPHRRSGGQRRPRKPKNAAAAAPVDVGGGSIQ